MCIRDSPPRAPPPGPAPASRGVSEQPEQRGRGSLGAVLEERLRRHGAEESQREQGAFELDFEMEGGYTDAAELYDSLHREGGPPDRVSFGGDTREVLYLHADSAHTAEAAATRVQSAYRTTSSQCLAQRTPKSSLASNSSMRSVMAP